MLDRNLSAILDPMTEKEKRVKEEIERRFFSRLSQRHWEGIEVQEYRKQMKDQ